MSRLGRDFSWHLSAFIIVVAGLGILAPVVWQQSRPAYSSAGLRRPQRQPARQSISLQPRSYRAVVRPSKRSVILFASRRLAADTPHVDAPEPRLANEIELDPSVSESPALPSVSPQSSDEMTGPTATGDLRLTATPVRRTDLPLPDSQTGELLREPEYSPSGSEALPLQPEQAAERKPWAYPTSLVKQLEVVAAAVPSAATWAEGAKVEVERLIRCESLADPGIADEIMNLRRLAKEAKTIAPTLSDEPSKSKVLRAGYAITRRLAIWELVRALAEKKDIAIAPVVNRHSWLVTLDTVDSMLAETGAALHWRKYLLLDRARTDFESETVTPTQQRRLARDILHRLHTSQLSSAQEEFLNHPPFKAWAKQLEARASETPDLSALLLAIERYESEDRSAAAHGLSDQYDVLRWSPHAAVRELAETVNTYYRNANVRVALSSELVNRMIPPQTPQVEAVEDNILGAVVSGQSQTNTNLKITLLPDDHRWNVGLEAIGQVASTTASSKGPATFYQKGWSVFRARKRLTVDHRGIRLFSAEAQANANNDLNNFETDFDGIPLLGGFVRAIARNQYDSSQHAAKAEVETRIAGRATNQFDREVSQRLEQAKRDFQVKMVKPLQDLNLEPTAVHLATTAERLIGRYRIAARDQVAAYTPRPQAPGDSMLSAQVHESALNNALDKLNLHGRRVELTELYKEMTTRFTLGRKVEVPDDLPENVHVTFADEDPVRIDCQEGRVRLTIRLKELSQEGTKNRWTDFTVHAYYAPNADQLDANLVREGIIELIGERRPLPIGQRATLTAIFARVLSRNRQLHIINKQIAESPQLRDQQVTQFVIHDGWIGVALGPKAPGRTAAMYPRAKLE